MIVRLLRSKIPVPVPDDTWILLPLAVHCSGTAFTIALAFCPVSAIVHKLAELAKRHFVTTEPERLRDPDAMPWGLGGHGVDVPLRQFFRFGILQELG